MVEIRSYSVLRLRFCLACLLLVIGGCVSTTGGGAVNAERRQLLLVSSAQLDQMAAQGYAKLRTDAAEKGTLNTDAALTQRVRSIASRIAPQTAGFRADARDGHGK